MEDTRKQEENLIIVSTVEEYALKHQMKVSDVLRLFSKNKIGQILRSQYDVLHMLDLSESLDFVETYLGRAKA